MRIARFLAPVCLFFGLMCPISALAQVSLLHVTSCGPQSFPGLACTIPATSQGSLLVVGWQIGGGANTSTIVSGLNDNAGNLYVEAGAARSIDATAGSVAAIWYSANTIAGATSIVITPSVSVTNGAAVIWEFAGLGGASLDGAGALNSQSASSAPQSVALTASSANEVIVSLAPVAGNITGINSGNSFVSDSTLKGNGWAHIITSAAGTYSTQWVQSPGGTYASSTASFKAANIFSACDLNQDGVVNMTDVQLSVNMTLGMAPCAANIGGAGVCNIAVIQRVVNAALGGACITGRGTVPHYVSLTWNASTSSNVVGYNVYRGTSSGGPYSTKVNSFPVSGTTYTDTTVLAGQTYYYVCTAVDASSNESSYSSPASANIPTP